ncbi:zinc-dependent metalloprotease [Aliidiomarina minuta]|nr:zinc-dependent metalloprotease [Aliidiomarina minuta]
MMTLLSKSTLATLLALSLGTAPALADENGDEDKTYADHVAELIASEGIFNFYRDDESGKTMLSISEEQLDTPFIYHAQTMDGVVEAGHFRGNYRQTRLLEFRRHYDRIDVVSYTPRYQFDENNPLSRAADANISEAVLASLPVEAFDSGRILVEADPLFLSQALHRVAPWANPNASGPQFSLGGLSTDRSRILRERVYDDNMDIVVDYVFMNEEPVVHGSDAVVDPRFISIKLQHSFIALPDNNYQPRRDDARVGYFTQQFDQMTNPEWAPYGDVINRWNLEKQDPDAELSDPVEPVVWWIENTTPHEWRDAIRQGVEDWNIAFEAAGFTNAMVVKEQPDDAEWDAGDINYNVLRWTSSPRPPFGGYGPSLANPLTGELIGSNIMLEFVFMSNRWALGELFSEGGHSGHEHKADDATMHCSLGHELQMGQMMARLNSNRRMGEDFADDTIMVQALRHLIMHEVGHTLGLNHNMKSHILWDNEEVHNAELTQGVLAGSVMDYNPVNLAPPGKQQGDYYSFIPGPYDLWAIEYGYSPALADAEAEEQRLESILSRSHEHGLAFGNDADDMRAPGRHIDPRIMTGAQSSDAIAYAVDRFNLVNHTFDSLLDKARQDGESHQELLTSANMLFGQYRGQANVITRFVGGIYVERAVVGQAEDVKPYTPVPREDQQRAMQALGQHVFAPDTMASMMPVLNYMQQQRRGFSHYGNNEDPKPHSMILNMQRGVFDHILHANVLQRLSDSAMYGNEYKLNDMLSDLSDSIFVGGRDLTTVSQNLQVEYVNRLIDIAGLKSSSGYDNLSQAAAVGQLRSIRDKSAPRRSSSELQNHYGYLHLLIDRAFEA